MSEASPDNDYDDVDLSELPDAVTPENVDELSEREIEAIQRKRQEQGRAVLREAESLSADEAAALEALSNGDSEEGTEVVELNNGVEVEVKTHIPGRVENRFTRMEGLAEQDPVEARGLLAENIADLILDSDYGSAAVWREYGDEYGSGKLMEMFTRVAEPAMQRSQELREQVESFRPQ